MALTPDGRLAARDLQDFLVQIHGIANALGPSKPVAEVPSLLFSYEDKALFQKARNQLLRDLGLSGATGRERGVAPSIAIGTVGQLKDQTEALLAAWKQLTKPRHDIRIALGIGAVLLVAAATLN